jgi:hypothetical protein
MRVPVDSQELERLVRRTRKALSAQTNDPEHVGPMARIAVASYPDFLAAFSAELRHNTLPPFIESAVLTLVANILLTLAHTAAGDDQQMLKIVTDAYLQGFIKAYAEKARILCGASIEEAAHTVEGPVTNQ